MLFKVNEFLLLFTAFRICIYLTTIFTKYLHMHIALECEFGIVTECFISIFLMFFFCVDKISLIWELINKV